jgi:hypothetical protein
MQFFPPLTGHRERHFNTLVAMICGLAGWSPRTLVRDR